MSYKKKKRVLVTGASGSVGIEVLKELRNRKDEFDVRVFDIRTKKTRKNGKSERNMNRRKRRRFTVSRPQMYSIMNIIIIWDCSPQCFIMQTVQTLSRANNIQHNLVFVQFYRQRAS